MEIVCFETSDQESEIDNHIQQRWSLVTGHLSASLAGFGWVRSRVSV